MGQIKVVFAVCKAKDLLKYLGMSNKDIETFGHVTVLELLHECQENGSVVIPFRGIEAFHLENKQGVC